MEQAVASRKKAYAYSQFKVGTYFISNGQIILGSNQENAAYPSGLAQKSSYFMQDQCIPMPK
jgi:cytidine deaminase